MATISKFYLLDAATPNTGTMPTGAFVGGNDATGDADGTTRNARDATDVAGASNPDVKSLITATANQVAQLWGHRRFVSRPLAAQTFANADGSWTFSAAYQESNLNHNMQLEVQVYCWRPGTGARVGTGSVAILLPEPTAAGTEEAHSANGSWSLANPVTISDGDILVFEVFSTFTQGMSTAYTDQFSYNGTTEASATTCASFVTPPAALTLQASGTTYTKAGFAKESA